MVHPPTAYRGSISALNTLKTTIHSCSALYHILLIIHMIFIGRKRSLPLLDLCPSFWFIVILFQYLLYMWHQYLLEIVFPGQGLFVFGANSYCLQTDSITNKHRHWLPAFSVSILLFSYSVCVIHVFKQKRPQMTWMFLFHVSKWPASSTHIYLCCNTAGLRITWSFPMWCPRMQCDKKLFYYEDVQVNNSD